jgi:hypothetical protein
MMRGRWERGWLVCPMCAGLRMHTQAEHRELVRVIRHPLQPELWGEDDYMVASKGHHQPARFLAAIQADAEVAWALDLLDNPELAEDQVRHQWRRWVRAKVEGEWGGWWKQVAEPGPGVAPFTVVDLP